MQLLTVDTETSGMDPSKDGIVEMAGVWRSGDALRFYTSVCNPGVPVEPDARAAHHITDAEIAASPAPLHCLHKMIAEHGSAAHDRIYVAHNASFDRSFFQRLSESMGIVNRWICTYRCAMHLWPDAPSYKNQTLRYYLELEPDIPTGMGLHAHRALYDAIVTEEILQAMLRQRRIEELIALSQSPVLLKKVGFGKHRGDLWERVPTSYLQWIVRQSEMDEDTLHTARYYLRAR